MTAASMRDRFTEAEPVQLFPAPDMSILSGGRTTPPIMPTRMFGNVWPLISDLAEGAGAPADYVAVSVVAVAASLIGGKRRVRPFKTGNWSEPCILWLGSVGDPSSNKSPAIDAGTEPLRGMEADHADDHKAAMLDFHTRSQRAQAERKQWNAEVEKAAKDGSDTPQMPETAVAPDEPQRRRLFVQDSTPEAVAAILAGNPRGTLHLRDELAGWLTSFERYSPGGREFWLEAFGGRQFTVDRKSNPIPLRLPFNGVSVLGGIQPEKLAALLLNGADDGLVARFIWAWPDALPYQRPRRIADAGRLERLYRRLDSLRYGMDQKGDDEPITLTLEDRAADLFEEWVREHQAGIGQTASLYKGFCGKLKGQVLRLALVAELLNWADNPSSPEPVTVSAESTVAAIEFAEDYAKPTALRVFGDAALPPVERDAAALGRWIIQTRPTKINARSTRRECGIPALRDAAPMNDAIAFLIEADWLRPAPSREGGTAGRQRLDYIVNPALHEARNG